MANDLYRPSNGTEGMGFIGTWCGCCERDRDQACAIVAAAFAYDVEDPEYPRQWRLNAHGSPECTAFVPEGEPVPAPRCDRTLDLFGGV